eukprot:1629499-Rhodomonas_salina.3
MRREGVLRVHEVRAHVLHREIPLDLRLVGLDGARRRPPCRLHHRRVGAPAGVLQPLVLGPVLGRELPCVPRRLQRVLAPPSIMSALCQHPTSQPNSMPRPSFLPARTPAAEAPCPSTCKPPPRAVTHPLEPNT